MQIIPAIDLLDGRVVRLLRGKKETAKVYSENPVSVALQWESQGADLIHVVDLNAAFNDGNNREAILRLCEQTRIPLQIAGGIRSPSAASDLITAGAARIVLGSIVFSDVEGTAAILRELGSDRVVVALDHVSGVLMTHGWKTSTGVCLEDTLETMVSAGMKRFLVTAIDRDGAMTGPDFRTLSALCADNRFDILASGGISTLEDVQNLRRIGATGAIIGKALYEDRLNVATLRAAMSEAEDSR